GYARATGKVGVCLATSGPGATNLVTGIATAYMDSVHMVAITCNVNLPLLGKDSFQEVDIAGVTMPITKHGYIVKDVNILADTLRKAFKIAESGRPGPVLVDITKDVTANLCEYEPGTADSLAKDASQDKQYTREDIDKVLELMQKAKKPYIYVGGGAVISEAAEEVTEFAKKLDAPVCDTLMGKGAFDGHDALYTGMIGMHGTKTSNLGVSECDLLVALGARFSDRVVGNAAKFASHAKVVQIDIDAAEINKNIRTEASVVGDLKEVLTEINRLLPQMEHREWVGHIQEMKEKYPLNYNKNVLSCPYVMEELDRVTGGEAIVTTDVGQHQMWAAQYYKYSKPRTFISSGGLGTMGYGLGACIGAKMGKPEKICVNIAGDGCFRMNMNELATASRYNIPIIQIVINNHVLGMVRQWQTLFYGQRYSQTVLNDKVDFCMVAQGLGCGAIKVTKKEEVGPAIEKAIAMKMPVLIECVIPEDDKVFPMVPAGEAISEAFDETDLEKK
ncbi:MAG: biosynthetic-type acetolactate synthase large subunit, partial [Kineothrix sp.]|nr:biosynthetic-type acetolactate synthase large subunit [Kineothrix sp.]